MSTRSLFFIPAFLISIILNGNNYFFKEKKDTSKYKIVNEKGKTVKFSDFKGKVVYVDFWANWCGPCKRMMVNSKELHHKFTKAQLKKIVFVYVSVDNDSMAWRKGVEEIAVEGINLFSPAQWPDGAWNYFHVTGLPRFMTINKKGNIAAYIAKTPLQEGVYENLIALINED